MINNKLFKFAFVRTVGKYLAKRFGTKLLQTGKIFAEDLLKKRLPSAVGGAAAWTGGKRIYDIAAGHKPEKSISDEFLNNLKTFGLFELAFGGLAHSPNVVRAILGKAPVGNAVAEVATKAAPGLTSKLINPITIGAGIGAAHNYDKNDPYYSSLKGALVGGALGKGLKMIPGAASKSNFIKNTRSDLITATGFEGAMGALEKNLENQSQKQQKQINKILNKQTSEINKANIKNKTNQDLNYKFNENNIINPINKKLY